MADIKIKNGSGVWASLKSGDKIKKADGTWAAIKNGDKIKKADGTWETISIGNTFDFFVTPDTLHFPAIVAIWETVTVTLIGSTLGWTISSEPAWVTTSIVSSTVLKVRADNQGLSAGERWGQIELVATEEPMLKTYVYINQLGTI